MELIDLPDRFVRKIVLVERGIVPGPCWEYQGCRLKAGYGHVRVGKKLKLLHRVSYELLVEPIPDGFTLDHLCRNPPCANPAHMEPTTLLVNIMRGDGVGVRNAAKTHCPSGHPYEGENLRVHVNGRRRCAACKRAEYKRAA